MPWKCFITEPSDLACRSLRRYATDSKCSGPMSYHNISAVIDPEIPAASNKEGGFLKDGYEEDPRWPAKCACGYEFKAEDQWQVNVNRLYKGAPEGKLYVLRELPPGAMWNAHWLDAPKWQGPDGKAWVVMFPGGHEWVVYGPSSNGKPWKVQGVPPGITVSPSIGILPHYHGFIKGGIISEDADGRKFPGIPRTA